MSDRPLASIDVGSNTIRLLIGLCRDGVVVPRAYHREITRLAEGIASTGELGNGGIQRSLKALKDFTGEARGLGVERIYAVGTSALREAKNSGLFVNDAKKETGLEIEIISSEKEAALTCSGVLSSLDIPPCALITDMGGGSTEWIVAREGVPVRNGSVPVGVIKLHERHIRKDPPSGKEIAGLNEATLDAARAIKHDTGDSLTPGCSLVATAGTATTMAAIDLGLEIYDRERVHGHVIPLPRLREMLSALLPLPLAERTETPGLEPGRADLIIPGLTFTINIMEILGFGSMTTSDSGLLEGALMDLCREVRK